MDKKILKEARFHSRSLVRLAGAFFALIVSLGQSFAADGTEITLMKNVSTVETIEDHSGNVLSIRTDNFVITNPPTSISELVAFVERFNANLDDDELARHDAYTRRFYRETELLTPLYEEGKGGYFEKDYLEMHAAELLCVVEWELDQVTSFNCY